MRQPRLALCLEQTLGHRTHSANLEAAAGTGFDVLPLDYPEAGRLRVPWALRGSAGALRALGRHRYDGALFHTQTIALFAPLTVPARRYVVSVDATPVQLDAMGRWYAHRRHADIAERAKRRWYRRVLGGAGAVVAWSEWAARSLVADYGVARERIAIVHPGAPAALFEIPRPAPRRRPRILFVGGDLDRKGGDLLLRAFEPLAACADLVVVTEAAVSPRIGVDIRHGIRAGSAEHLAAFQEADIFCLPTRGDCTPVAIGEAMAAGLPVVTSDVGSNPEVVPEGTGFVVPANDDEALRASLRTLVDDAALRQRLGAAARDRARSLMDARANAGRVLQLVRNVAA